MEHLLSAFCIKCGFRMLNMLAIVPCAVLCVSSHRPLLFALRAHGNRGTMKINYKTYEMDFGWISGEISIYYFGYSLLPLVFCANTRRSLFVSIRVQCCSTAELLFVRFEFFILFSHRMPTVFYDVRSHYYPKELRTATLIESDFVWISLGALLCSVVGFNRK